MNTSQPDVLSFLKSESNLSDMLSLEMEQSM